MSRARSKWVIGDEAAPVELGHSLAFLPQAGKAGSWELQVEGSAASHSWDV